jgi:hypothetical protein
VRVLGVPTVADRIAQTAVAMVLEPLVEPVFHDGCESFQVTSPGDQAAMSSSDVVVVAG